MENEPMRWGDLDERQKRLASVFMGFAPHQQDQLIRLFLRLNNGDNKAKRLLEMSIAGQLDFDTVLRRM